MKITKYLFPNVNNFGSLYFFRPITTRSRGTKPPILLTTQIYVRFWFESLIFFHKKSDFYNKFIKLPPSVKNDRE